MILHYYAFFSDPNMLRIITGLVPVLFAIISLVTLTLSENIAIDIRMCIAKEHFVLIFKTSPPYYNKNYLSYND